MPNGPTVGCWEHRRHARCVHIRPILVDPCVYLISSADETMAGDDDIDVARHAFEQPQRGEVVLDRISDAVQVEHRNQDIRKRSR
jgi:hypothetical protein